MDGMGAIVAERGSTHIPVLRDEVLTGLAVRPHGRYLDATFGRGGHARAILERLAEDGRLLLMDRDGEAIDAARRDFANDPRVAIRHGNFADLESWDEAQAGLDGVLLDLGVSSPQLDDPSRGFSFMADAPLDMRMDTSAGVSAAEFIEHADEREIADVLWRYGEERMSRRIARAIVARRVETPIRTTRELAELVERAIGRRERNKHPATRTFQGLRIHVNDELGSLECGLRAATSALNPGGRLAVISFHSLEDRIVKRFIRGDDMLFKIGPSKIRRVKIRRGLPQPEVAPSPLRAIGRAQFPSDTETRVNPRARSAVLRIAEKRTDDAEHAA